MYICIYGCVCVWVEVRMRVMYAFMYVCISVRRVNPCFFLMVSVLTPYSPPFIVSSGLTCCYKAQTILVAIKISWRSDYKFEFGSPPPPLRRSLNLGISVLEILKHLRKKYLRKAEKQQIKYILTNYIFKPAFIKIY